MDPAPLCSPVIQEVHVAAPAAENVLAGQSGHPVCEPLLRLPAGQIVQPLDPAELMYPGLQFMQAVAPTNEYVPAGHVKQLDLSALVYVPRVH